MNDRCNALSDASLVEVVVALDNDEDIAPQREILTMQAVITSKPENGVA
jgi:hypothetical protein